MKKTPCEFNNQMQFLKQFEERVSCRKLIQFPKTNSRITYGSGTT
ncbi:MAG: hypothetical protein ACI88H_003127, partial [Cocleimonas sp.]